MNKIIICAAMIMVAFSCSMGGGSNEAESRFSKKVGEKAAIVLANPDKVFVVKVVPTRKPEYIEDSEPRELTLDQVETLRRMLLSDSSYTFDKFKKCIFIPQVAYKFEGEELVTVYVSHFCNQIRVVSPDTNVVIDYDPIADKLNAFSQKLTADLIK